MNKKLLYAWIKRILYLVVFIIAVERGYGWIFILGVTLVIGIWKRKEIWKTMNQWGEYFEAQFRK